MAIVTVTEQLDPPDLPEGDARRLEELGYEQELKRGMGIFDSVAMGFATISPVVGLYAVLYVLLSLEAYSLLIGSLLLFAALAGVMYATRRIDWGARGEAPQQS